MQDTIELVCLMILLVAGHHAIDERRHGALNAARSFVMWVLFFGVIIALMFFPVLVAWLLRAGAVFVAYYCVSWLVHRILSPFHGPHIVQPMKSKPAVNLTREILAALDDEGADALADALRRQPKRARGLARRYGSAVFFRAALSRLRDADLATLEAQATAFAEEAEAIHVDLAAGSGATRSRWDRAFVAEALLVYDAASVRKLMARAKAPLGGKGARRATAERLGAEAKRTPLAATLAAAGVYHDPDPRDRRRAKIERVRVAPAKLIQAMVFPPIIYIASGQGGRGLLLAATLAALLAYSIFAMAIGRTVGWIYLATWGLIQILAMFAVWDVLREAEGPDVGVMG